jgi:hypothetical protein
VIDLRVVPLLVGSCVVLAATGSAQPSRPRGQPVALMIHPRVGDTLRMHYEQRTDVRADDESPITRSVSTTIMVHTQSVVEASEPSLTTVLASTDSGWIAFRAVDPRPGVGVTESRMQLPGIGSRVRLEVSTDGSTEVVSTTGPAGAAQQSLVSQAPAMLPKRPVLVGDSWTRDIPLPPAASAALKGAGDVAGTVRAIFRFDSLTARGRKAWVSVRATLRRDEKRADAPTAARVVSSGTLTGTLVLDRTRAWMVEMRTSVALVSDLVPGAAESTPPVLFAPLGRTPRRAVVKIEQIMRAR